MSFERRFRGGPRRSARRAATLSKTFLFERLAVVPNVISVARISETFARWSIISCPLP